MRDGDGVRRAGCSPGTGVQGRSEDGAIIAAVRTSPNGRRRNRALPCLAPVPANEHAKMSSKTAVCPLLSIAAWPAALRPAASSSSDLTWRVSARSFTSAVGRASSDIRTGANMPEKTANIKLSRQVAPLISCWLKTNDDDRAMSGLVFCRMDWRGSGAGGRAPPSYWSYSSHRSYRSYRGRRATGQ